MDRKTVYIETSIVSYLTARPSGNLLAAAWQKVTIDWWDTQRERFNLYVSATVIEEAKKGDSLAAARRVEVVENISFLPITEAVAAFAKLLINEKALPEKALDDALHIAVSAVHKIDYLLTWNCRHIDNAETKPIIRRICEINGYFCPEICTPQELMGVSTDD
jgi:predicted nucleic acid-binding protein